MSSIQLLIEFVFSNILYIILFVPFITLIKHVINNLIVRLSLPSGPICFPIVGYSPFLGKQPHKYVTKLGDKYGNVFTLQLGVQNTVVLNNWEAVKEAFHSDAFLGKPAVNQFRVVNNATSLSSKNGEEWRDHRRFTLQVLRDLGFGKGLMEDRITDEITYLTKLIDESNGQPLNIRQLLVPSISNNISHLVFGHRMDFNDPKRILMDKMLGQMSRSFSSIGSLGLSSHWINKLMHKFGSVTDKKQFDIVNSIYDDEIASHQKSLDLNHKRDYIDGYLIEMQSRQLKDPNTHFDLKTLKAICWALFGAGSETMITTIEWLLILSAKYLEHQKRIQQEIDSVIGRDRSAVYADRQYMPYTQAFINEMFRLKNVVPWTVRCALEDSYILGHFIPKNTRVLVNSWAVHHDPKVWDKPEEFNPNRFLTPDGKQVIKNEQLIAFNAGKRSCVGETLARTKTFLYLVSLLQRYAIRSVNNHTLSLEDKFGLTLQPKQHPIIAFHRRY